MHTHTQARTRTCIHVHQYLGGDAGAVTSDVKVVHGNVARGQVEDEEVRVLGDRAAAMLCVFMRLSVRFVWATGPLSTQRGVCVRTGCLRQG